MLKTQNQLFQLKENINVFRIIDSIRLCDSQATIRLWTIDALNKLITIILKKEKKHKKKRIRMLECYKFINEFYFRNSLHLGILS